MDGKNPVFSKTIIFGLLQLVIGFCALLEGNDWIKQHPQAVAVAGIVSGFAVMILRFLTSVPLQWPPAAPEIDYRMVHGGEKVIMTDQIFNPATQTWDPVPSERVGEQVRYDGPLYRRPV